MSPHTRLRCVTVPHRIPTYNEEMLILSNEQLIGQVQLQTGLIHRNLDDLSDAEGCIAPHGANSANWLLGHVLVSRDEVCQMLGVPHQLGAALHQRYGQGTAPVTAAGGDEIPLRSLLKMLDEQSVGYFDALRGVNDEVLAREITRPNGSTTTLGQRLMFYIIFHEATHIGGFEFSRHAAGKHAGLI